MKSNGNAGFVFFTGIIIAICRFTLGKVNSVPNDVILIVMALVNYVALGFVFLFLYNDVINICWERIKENVVMTKEKSRAHFLIKIPSLFLLVAYLLLGIWYTTYLRSTDLNDSISIVALALSIASSGLAKTISSLYYKIVIKIITHTKKSKGA